VKYFKKTFLWIIALVVLIGYNWLEVENTRIETEAKEEATRLFPFDAIEVLSITLRKEGQTLDLERWEDGWRIVAPVKAPADSEAVDKFLGYVLDSRNDSEYVMDSDPTEERLAEFGLKDPVNSVTLRVGRDLTDSILATERQAWGLRLPGLKAKRRSIVSWLSPGLRPTRISIISGTKRCSKTSIR
jgi:hypothetical protein